MAVPKKKGSKTRSKLKNVFYMGFYKYGWRQNSYMWWRYLDNIPLARYFKYQRLVLKRLLQYGYKYRLVYKKIRFVLYSTLVQNHFFKRISINVIKLQRKVWIETFNDIWKWIHWLYTSRQLRILHFPSLLINIIYIYIYKYIRFGWLTNPYMLAQRSLKRRDIISMMLYYSFKNQKMNILHKRAIMPPKRYNKIQLFYLPGFNFSVPNEQYYRFVKAIIRN